MESIIHRVKNITSKLQTFKRLGNDDEILVYYTKTITVTDENGLEFKLTLFSDEKEDLVLVEK